MSERPPAPTLPAEHPLRAYGEYVIGRMEGIAATQATIYWMCFVGVVILCLLVVVFSVFAYLKWQEWRELQGWRADTVKQTEVTNTLLNVIRGWTVVHVEEERRKTEAVEKATADIKATVPEATAEAVVAKITGHGSQLSSDGTLPTVLTKSGTLKKSDLNTPPHRTDPD